MNWGKKVLSVWMAGGLLVLAACSRGEPVEEELAAVAGPSAMSVEEYAAQVRELKEAETAFGQANSRLLELVRRPESTVGEMIAGTEKLRGGKQPYLDFAAIETPAEGFEDAHAALVKACVNFSAIIDEYCDRILAVLRQEVSETGEEELIARMSDAIEDVRKGIAAVETLSR